MTIPAATPTTPIPVPSEVLQSDHHRRFTVQDIAKAVARHQREHPSETAHAAKPQKTAPRP